MFFSTRNKRLLKQLGVPIWELRNSPKLDFSLKKPVSSKTKENLTPAKPKKPIDCLILVADPYEEAKRSGGIFDGLAGNLLSNMLKASNLFSCDLHLINIFENKLSGKGGVSLPEAEDKHSHFLFEQLELISPKVIFAMGMAASEIVVGSEFSILDLRGKVHFNRDLKIPIIVSYEPSHLIKTPLDKPKAWTDLQLLMRTLRKYS